VSLSHLFLASDPERASLPAKGRTKYSYIQPDKNQPTKAIITRYTPVGSSDFGKTFSRYGSRMISAWTGGTFSMRVLLSV
jgi:hypothetical protein